MTSTKTKCSKCGKEGKLIEENATNGLGDFWNEYYCSPCDEPWGVAIKPATEDKHESR